MGYYIRVLGKTDRNIRIDEFINELAKYDLVAEFSLDENETADNWTLITVANSNGEDLMQIERNVVVKGELGAEELLEFREDIKNYKPTSAVKWLSKYFGKVKVIYAFQILGASMDNNNSLVIDSIKSTIWSKTGGILQADNEGFSNEEGYHILWQFPENVSGNWNMAVRDFFGNWTNFTMDLGNQKQREEFWKGNVPKDVTKL